MSERKKPQARNSSKGTQAKIFKAFEETAKEGTLRIATIPEIEKMLENPCNEIPLGPHHRSEVKAPEETKTPPEGKKTEVFAVVTINTTSALFGGSSENLLAIASTVEGARKVVDYDIKTRLNAWDGRGNLYIPSYLVRRKVLTE